MRTLSAGLLTAWWGAQSPSCLSKKRVTDIRTRGKFNPLEKGMGNLYPLPHTHTQTQEALSLAPQLRDVSRGLPKSLAWDVCQGCEGLREALTTQCRPGGPGTGNWPCPSPSWRQLQPARTWNCWLSRRLPPCSWTSESASLAQRSGMRQHEGWAWQTETHMLASSPQRWAGGSSSPQTHSVRVLTAPTHWSTREGSQLVATGLTYRSLFLNSPVR